MQQGREASVSVSATLPAAVSGRPFSTSREALERAAFALFEERGFDQTSIDDIADAAGIGRRTFFRYYPSKNDLVWGNFEQELLKMRTSLESSDPEMPLMEAIRESVVGFNLILPGNEQAHRRRMQMILGVPTLIANSTLRFASWRIEIARFAAARLGVNDDALVPVLIGYSALGVSITAYEQWLRSDDADLSALLNDAFDELAAGFRQDDRA